MNNDDLFLQQMLSALNPDIVARLKLAVEIGKWPDGRRLTTGQRETCMQAVIVWESRHLPEEQRVGYIDKGEKEGESCDHPPEAENPVKFIVH